MTTPVSPGDASVCSDCGRPFACDAHEQTLTTFCATGTGSPSCQHFTIAKLRNELTEAKAKLESRAVPVPQMVEALAATEYLEQLLRHNADSQIDLRRADEALGVVRKTLQSAQQASELSAAEREVVATAVGHHAAQDRYHWSSGPAWLKDGLELRDWLCELRSKVDALLALRARGEG